MSKRTIPEGSDALPPIAKRTTPAVIEDDAVSGWYVDDETGMRRIPDWVLRHCGQLRIEQLECRMRHNPGTCKHCAIVIE